MKIIYLAVSALMLTLSATSHAQQAGHQGHHGLTVTDAWARPPLTSNGAGAAYFTIKNQGAGMDRLVAVKTDVSKRAQLHSHKIRDGIARMRRVDGVMVAPNGSTILKPGGNHVMLMGVQGTLKPGTAFPITLVFEKAGEIVVQVDVQKPTARRKSNKPAGNNDHAGHGSQAGHQGHQSTQMDMPKSGAMGTKGRAQTGAQHQGHGNAAIKKQGTATTKHSDNKHYRVSIEAQQMPVKINALHNWVVQVMTSAGKPVEDAKVVITGGMPGQGHGHGLPTAPRVTKYLGAGKYLVEGVRFNMSGHWELKFAISGPPDDRVTFDLNLK